MKRIIAGGGILLALFLAGCETPQDKAGHEISNALPGILGPALSYQTNVSGSDYDLASGRASRVSAVGIDVQVSHSLQVDKLEAVATNVQFDARQRQIQSIGSLSFVCWLGQSNLSRYLRLDHPQDLLSATIGQRDLSIQLPITALGQTSIVTLRGSLSPDSNDPSALDFAADSANLGSLPVPAFLANAALQLVNPLIHIRATRFPMTIASASIVQGQIEVQGTARWKPSVAESTAPNA